MRLLLGILGILAVFVALPAQADVTGSPRVIDGDTIWIGETKIRLYGIDAPEAKQLCHRDGIREAQTTPDDAGHGVSGVPVPEPSVRLIVGARMSAVRG